MLAAARHDRSEPREAQDRTETAENAEPTDSAEHAEPIEPIEPTEPTDPMDRTEPSLATDRSESREAIDHCELTTPTVTAPTPHAAVTAQVETEVRMPGEATLTRTDSGLIPDGDGWFVVNARAARWRHSGDFGSFCTFEGDARFPDFGINIQVLQPGQPNGMYHSEEAQEDFLVLSGECLLLVEGEERPLTQWDFVHCPAGTTHIFVGAGTAPCAILMAGARPDPETLRYPVADVALKHKAGVETETPTPEEAYAPFEWPVRGPYRDGLLPSLA
jgi:uncharacterized cupin superfamily protein